MASKMYAVIDTNVIVSAMFTHNPESPTKLILDHILRGDVLSREQFFFKPNAAQTRITARNAQTYLVHAVISE